MTTPIPISIEGQSADYIPNVAQRERAAALRRFNWLFVYTPIIVLSLVTIALVILLLWGVFSPNIVGTEVFVSGLADVVIILFSLPLMLLCAVGPAALIGLIVMSVRRRRDPAATSLLDRLQTLLWRLESLIIRVLAKTKQTAPAVARPLIEAQARAAYLDTLKKHAKRILTRS